MNVGLFFYCELPPFLICVLIFALTTDASPSSLDKSDDKPIPSLFFDFFFFFSWSFFHRFSFKYNYKPPKLPFFNTSAAKLT